MCYNTVCVKNRVLNFVLTGEILIDPETRGSDKIKYSLI